MANTKFYLKRRSSFWNQGELWVWLTAMALMGILVLTFLFVGIVAFNGFSTFWPRPVSRLQLNDGGWVIGEIHQRTLNPATHAYRIQLKTGNRDLYGIDFRWVEESTIKAIDYPEKLSVWERREYGSFYGFLTELQVPKSFKGRNSDPNLQLKSMESAVSQDHPQMEKLQQQLATLNHQHSRLMSKRQTLFYHGSLSSPEFLKIESDEGTISLQMNHLQQRLETLQSNAHAYRVGIQEASGKVQWIPLPSVVRVSYPNRMSFSDKMLFYCQKWGELLWEKPREANTEGGLFPAIFGTMLMVFVMSLLAFPLGVMAAVYLKEYAKEGILIRLVRIAVNNLAGIPSIVYGVFGLGFFVYGLGGWIDRWFFAAELPSPTFGTGGILWSSLTLALLTLPVVIIATEEALSSVPQGMREASYALGSTQIQTIWRIVLPIASPGIMTGFILAMARAAGEVAPLMITGVVKLAPSLPIDAEFPYLHLERKFMHLGFHIYDVGFQSPNVEAAKPMVFVTTLLLMSIVLMMSALAIYLRQRMKKRYSIKSF